MFHIISYNFPFFQLIVIAASMYSDCSLFCSSENDFYHNPSEWLIKNSILPTHIVVYDVLVPKIKKYLQLNMYKEVFSPLLFYFLAITIIYIGDNNISCSLFGQ